MTQLVLPRANLGVNWGAKRRVLAAIRPNPLWGRTAEPRVMLFINQGHSAAHGARGFGRDYHPACLTLMTWDSPWPGRNTADLGKGRITKAMITAATDKIDAAFGAGTADKIDLKSTLWIEEEPSA